MQDDERCCGTGTCLINADGLCWCGQQWDGEKMARPANQLDSPQTDLAEQQAKKEEENKP